MFGTVIQAQRMRMRVNLTARSVEYGGGLAISKRTSRSSPMIILRLPKRRSLLLENSSQLGLGRAWSSHRCCMVRVAMVPLFDYFSDHEKAIR